MRPQQHDIDRYCEVLETENENLREENIAIKKLLADTSVVPVIFGLSPQESVVLGCLMARPIASRDMLHGALYYHRPDGDEEIEIKIVDVFVCHIRRKLKHFDLTIETKWGEGYYLTPETKEKIKNLKAETSI